MHSAGWPSARIYSASGMPKFRKFCNSFADFLRRFCVISTPDAHFFGSEQTDDLIKSCSDGTMFCVANSGRVRAINSAQGAPKFRKICNSFAGFWHKICVISTPRACFFGAERTMDSVQSFSDGIRFAQRVLAENNEFCARGAPKFRKIYISFVKFLRGFRVISTPDAHFFGSEQTSDFTESCSNVTRFTQRTLTECTQLFCERHAEIPEILQFFRDIFA